MKKTCMVVGGSNCLLYEKVQAERVKTQIINKDALLLDT